MDKVEMPVNKMMLLPPRPDCCQTCAVAHHPSHPHNPQSLYYQMAFQMENGRAPTWQDAMAHCSPEMKTLWINALAENGVKVEQS